MKMAAAEALYNTSDSCAPFSLFTVGSLDGTQEKFSISVPCVLSFLATGSPNGTVQGINQVEAAEQAKYAGSALTAAPTYAPTIWMAYWNFRLMMGAGFLTMIFALWALWKTRKGEPVTERYWLHIAIWSPLLVVFAMSFGWIFTEVGRQPWIVYGLLTTSSAVSPTVSAFSVGLTMVLFTLLYGALAVVEVKLMLKYIRSGAIPVEEPQDPSDRDADAPFVFAY